MKYEDILYYKQKLKDEFNVTSFVYIRFSKELFNILLKELNVILGDNSDYIFPYKRQFTYEGVHFLEDLSYKDAEAEFSVVLTGDKLYKPHNDKFATFLIEILSENERIIKKLLE